MDVFVKQSTVAPGLSSCFTQLNCKMWVKDSALAGGHLTSRHNNPTELPLPQHSGSSLPTLYHELAIGSSATSARV